MRHATPFSVSLTATILALLATAGATEAHAAEYCVTCDEPAAHYKCVLPGVTADPADTRLRLLCITELAKAGKHASCSVDRQQKAPCDGAVKEIAVPGGVGFAPPSAPPVDAGAQPAATPPPEAAGEPQPAQTDIPKTQKPPATVKEVVEGGVKSTEKAIEDGGHAVGEAAKETGSTFEKAGQAVGNAAKKTWNCISSFFGDC